MIVGLIASPFIPVPPETYGGTELFIATLAEALRDQGHDVIVYANGESRVGAEVCWMYRNRQHLPDDPAEINAEEITHTAWAMRDASASCDVIHINSAFGLPHTYLIENPVVYTVHHAHDDRRSHIYSFYSDVHYVCTSASQRRAEAMPRLSTIGHGVDLRRYKFTKKKERFLCFLGRIAPVKGLHLAIEAAKQAGIPLKIAGDIQPSHRDYFESKIRPLLDGDFVEYLGEADPQMKNELLGKAMALLFPMQGEGPLALVVLEAMACGTPVLALSSESLGDVVQNGVNGFVCRSVGELAKHAHDVSAMSPEIIRQNIADNFSAERMARDYGALYTSSIAEAATGCEVNISRAGFGPVKVTGKKSRIAGGLVRRTYDHVVILCIDDDVQQLELEKALLQLKGYEVLTAPSGAIGLSMLEAADIDAVILDYCMPEMDGAAVALAIRSKPSRIPIIVRSGSELSDLPTELFELTNGFISKGASPEVLFSLVKQATGAVDRAA